MSSTEPANNDHCPGSGASTCGLVGSLFPTSCRGRAEAFARRLHRRLTSLSGPDKDLSPTSSKPSETSWLHSNNHHNLSLDPQTSRIHERQPRHSPESDLYYDFDLSPERENSQDPGSPEEAVTAAEFANLLVNTSKILNSSHDSYKVTSNSIQKHLDESNQDRESGYVFSSPLDANTPTDSEVYYDPESSEADKTRTDDFCDPITSESETPMKLSNGDIPNVHKPPGRRRLENGRKHEDTSDDSSLSCNGRVKQSEARIQPIVINNSSDESLNDVASSLETTSPSHESLWSTFDESTVSLQDDISFVTGTPTETRFLKSHSDSELIPGVIKMAAIDLESIAGDEVDHVRESVQDLGDWRREPVGDYCNGDIGADPVTRKEESSAALEDHSTYSSTFDIPGALEVECPIEKASPVEKTLTNEVKMRVGETEEVSSVEDMSKLLKKLSCSPRGSFETDGKDEEGTEACEGNEDDERPQRVRRCSSLKTGKTPPGTPGRKKIVRFADVLGLDLADVRTFMDEIPKVPNSAYSDLIYDDVFQKDSSPSLYGSSPTNGSGLGMSGGLRPDRVLLPMFQQPGGLPNFLDRVRDRQVCLENVVVQDPITLCLRGSVRVRNLDFHKSVHVRYTMDSWRTFSDLQAQYVNGSCDGFSDKFTFIVYCHNLRVGQRIEMAVRFQCKGTQYWDNNAGVNYCFQCLPMTTNSHYLPIGAGTGGSHDWVQTFY